MKIDVMIEMEKLIAKRAAQIPFSVNDYYTLLTIYKQWYGKTIAPFYSNDIYNLLEMQYKKLNRIKNLQELLNEKPCKN